MQCKFCGNELKAGDILCMVCGNLTNEKPSLNNESSGMPVIEKPFNNAVNVNPAKEELPTNSSAFEIPTAEEH